MPSTEPGLAVPSPIELQRARRRLQVFCEQRVTGGSAASEWSFTQDDNAFEIYFRKKPVLRLRYQRETWYLTVPHADGAWLAYPPRPQLSGIDAVIEELEQAPLHVHW